jgi:hypothetical protein
MLWCLITGAKSVLFAYELLSHSMICFANEAVSQHTNSVITNKAIHHRVVKELCLARHPQRGFAHCSHSLGEIGLGPSS